MTTQDIASRLTELCRSGKFEVAQKELYSEDAESFEPEHAQLQYAKGLDALKNKGDQFQSMIEETHGGYVTDPVIAGNQIALGMGMDVTMKGMGRINMEEIAIYKVAGGKIVSETFIY